MEFLTLGFRLSLFCFVLGIFTLLLGVNVIYTIMLIMCGLVGATSFPVENKFTFGIKISE